MRILLPLLAALALLLAAPAAASAGTLYGEVKSDMTIVLKNAAGARVNTVRAGSTWTVVVRDRSNAHNFRLTGPGFAGRQTGIAFQGNQTWTITFRRGTWTYLCTEHPDMMRGTVRAR